MRPEDEEPIDLAAIRRDDALIDALASGAVAAARAMTDPDDPLIKLIDEYAECAARLREAFLDTALDAAGLTEARRVLLARRALLSSPHQPGVKPRALRAALVVTGLVTVVGVVVWRGLRR